MCAINGKCGCNGDNSAFWEFLFVGSAKLTWWLLKKLAQAAQLLFVGLLAAAIWTTPRVYRLSRRTAGAVRRWYVTRPVLLPGREPVAAVTATTTAPTLADLRLTKKEATVR